MLGIRTIRIWKHERAQEKEQKKAEEEQKKRKEELEKANYLDNLKRLREKVPEYVLTISASDYIEGVGKKLTDYKFSSVSAKSGYGQDSMYEGALERIASEGEKINAEIITDVRSSEDEYHRHLIGTALIPKSGEAKK